MKFGNLDRMDTHLEIVHHFFLHSRNTGQEWKWRSLHVPEQIRIALLGDGEMFQQLWAFAIGLKDPRQFPAPNPSRSQLLVTPALQSHTLFWDAWAHMWHTHMHTQSFKENLRKKLHFIEHEDFSWACLFPLKISVNFYVSSRAFKCKKFCIFS